VSNCPRPVGMGPAVSPIGTAMIFSLPWYHLNLAAYRRIVLAVAMRDGQRIMASDAMRSDLNALRIAQLHLPERTCVADNPDTQGKGLSRISKSSCTGHIRLPSLFTAMTS
jgi:hypothetical protein